MRKRQQKFCLLIAGGLLAMSAATAQAKSTCTAPSVLQLASLKRAVDKDLAPTPRAIPRVHTEGTLPHEGIWDASVEAKRDWPLVQRLAQLWQAKRHPEDALALSRLMADWVRIYQPSFNPIDETGMDAFIDAYAIAREALAPEVQISAREFIRGIS